MKNRKKYFLEVDKKRSYTMSCIKSEDTSIEKKLRSLLWEKGYRFRKNVKNILGKPDIVFTKKRVLIFCDGSFWHGKDFNKKIKKIENNKKYWIEKIKTNIERDKKINKDLSMMNWKVLRFWDTDIKENPDKVINKIEEHLNEE